MTGAALDAYLGNLAAGGSADLLFEMRLTVRGTRHYGGLPALAGALGITHEAIKSAGGLGILKITTDLKITTEGRYFEPAANGDGHLAVIVPVYEINSDGGAVLVDLVASRIDAPSRTWIRTGYARALGSWNADAIRDATPIWRLPSDPPLPVLMLYRTPLSWLRAACDGTCIINSTWAEYVLGGIGRVQPEDDGHARDLHRELTGRPTRLPQIVVPQERAA